MIKWIVITFGVLTGFFVILLGMGYLLKNNEEKHVSYNNQIQNAQHVKKSKPNKPKVVIQFTTIEQSKSFQVIKNNLTCVNDAQCVVAPVSFVDEKCTVAINRIGASLLQKSNNNESIGKCSEEFLNPIAVCRKNLCEVIENSTSNP